MPEDKGKEPVSSRKAISQRTIANPKGLESRCEVNKLIEEVSKIEKRLTMVTIPKEEDLNLPKGDIDLKFETNKKLAKKLNEELLNVKNLELRSKIASLFQCLIDQTNAQVQWYVTISKRFEHKRLELTDIMDTLNGKIREYRAYGTLKMLLENTDVLGNNLKEDLKQLESERKLTHGKVQYKNEETNFNKVEDLIQKESKLREIDSQLVQKEAVLLEKENNLQRQENILRIKDAYLIEKDQHLIQKEKEFFEKSNIKTNTYNIKPFKFGSFQNSGQTEFTPKETEFENNETNFEKMKFPGSKHIYQMIKKYFPEIYTYETIVNKFPLQLEGLTEKDINLPKLAEELTPLKFESLDHIFDSGLNNILKIQEVLIRNHISYLIWGKIIKHYCLSVIFLDDLAGFDQYDQILVYLFNNFDFCGYHRNIASSVINFVGNGEPNKNQKYFKDWITLAKKYPFVNESFGFIKGEVRRELGSSFFLGFDNISTFTELFKFVDQNLKN